jgi:hypothetical protein
MSPIRGMNRLRLDVARGLSPTQRRHRVSGQLVQFALASQPKGGRLCLSHAAVSNGDSMRRRDFITILGGAAAAPVIRPGSVPAATSPKRAIIAMPLIGGPYIIDGGEIGQSFIDAFLQGLQGLGYVLDRDFEIALRLDGGDVDRYPTFIEKEIVPLKPGIIYASATMDAVAARKATSTIPIVSAALADPVRLGLIASEARPGHRNIALYCWIAGETNRTRTRNGTGCKCGWAAYKFDRSKGSTPSP